jgi:hypothetical protein
LTIVTIFGYSVTKYGYYIFRGAAMKPIRKSMELVNPSTGETMAVLPQHDLDELRSRAGLRPYGRLEGGYVAMFQEISVAMGCDKRLTGEDRAVFQVLLGQVKADNFIYVSQVELAKLMQMQKQHVSRAIIHLVQLEYLIEGPRLGRSKIYKLNPHVGWKGPALNHKPAKKGVKAPSKVIDMQEWKEQPLPLNK